MFVNNTIPNDLENKRLNKKNKRIEYFSVNIGVFEKLVGLSSTSKTLEKNYVSIVAFSSLCKPKVHTYVKK